MSPDATQSFTLTVVTSPPIITSANHATFTQGQAGTFTVTATGSPSPSFSENGIAPERGDPLQRGRALGNADPVGFLPDHHHREQRRVAGWDPVVHADGDSAVPDLDLFVGERNTRSGLRSGAAARDRPSDECNAQMEEGGNAPGGLKLSRSGVLFGTPNKKLVSGSNLSVPVQITETVITFVNNGGKHPKKVKAKTTVEKTLTVHIS